MNILITGSHGQVGRAMTWQAQQNGHTVCALTSQAMDITCFQKVEAYLSERKPDVVINAAAYTMVDRAEQEESKAFSVNVAAVEHLARCCQRQGIILVHFSSDYVFAGDKDSPYSEHDATAPQNVYGATKLAGEWAMRASCPEHYIIRTSWVFSAHGSNFVRTMLRLGMEKEHLSIVNDQWGKPTSAEEIARIVLHILESRKQAWGTYHLAQPDTTTWFAFAERIFHEARKQDIPLRLQEIHPIASVDYPTEAVRPRNSALACDRLQQSFDISIRPWQQSLSSVIRMLAQR